MQISRKESDWRKYREMGDELRAICVEAVGLCKSLPEDARENRHAVGRIEIFSPDQSYVEFLEGQIELDVRGPEWSQRLKIRRDNLAEFTGRELASCRLPLSDNNYWIKIDPVAVAVVHWEVYNEDTMRRRG